MVLGVLKKLAGLVLHVCVCVWNCVGEPNLVFEVFKLILKAQRVIVFHALAVAVIILEELVVVEISCKFRCVHAIPRYVVLDVLNVFTGSMPAVLVGPERVNRSGIFRTHFLKLFCAKNDRFHARLIQTVGFSEIQNVELNLCRFLPFVDNLEVEPLGMTLRIQIVFKPKVVLDIIYLCCLPKIP